ncbi:aminoglycoside phosphotransferase family protein [Nocardia sp. NPDC047038]|uniref:phosphotransferase family protein n=1 Tax=Nocardia sp. NPDC047038 TaxID=3154338 RepID=UPI0033EE47F8
MEVEGLDGDVVAAAVVDMVPDAAPVAVDEVIPKGHRHFAWRMRSNVGPVVARVRRGDGYDEVALSRLREHQRLALEGLPVPRAHGFGVSQRLGGRSLVVTEYLDGVDAEDFAATAAGPVMVDAMRSTGKALARLHTVSVSGFGDPQPAPNPAATDLAGAARRHLERLAELYAELPENPLRQAGERLLLLLADDLRDVVCPTVTHQDVYLPNILLDRHGRFRALLDLEHLRWADPVSDFVKPAMWMFDDHPEWAVSFADGYRTVAGTPTRWEERISLATGWELLTGVGYWTSVGDDVTLQDYLARLRRWVASDGISHVWSPDWR